MFARVVFRDRVAALICTACVFVAGAWVQVPVAGAAPTSCYFTKKFNPNTGREDDPPTVYRPSGFPDKQIPSGWGPLKDETGKFWAVMFDGFSCPHQAMPDPDPDSPIGISIGPDMEVPTNARFYVDRGFGGTRPDGTDLWGWTVYFPVTLTGTYQFVIEEAKSLGGGTHTVTLDTTPAVTPEDIRKVGLQILGLDAPPKIASITSRGKTTIASITPPVAGAVSSGKLVYSVKAMRQGAKKSVAGTCRRTSATKLVECRLKLTKGTWSLVVTPSNRELTGPATIRRIRVS